MSTLAFRLKEKFFREEHPYRTLEREVERNLQPSYTLLDAGCGRGAPMLMQYKGKAARLIGVDVVDFEKLDGLELLQDDLGNIPLASASVDLVMSRSVMEHITDPEAVYKEIFRILKPGGRFIFLTANLWDYASLIAKVIPNRLHPMIVARTEGRAEQDVFPVAYRTNTAGAVRRWAGKTGFELISVRYLGQYPSYFMFNAFFFLLATGYEKFIRKFPILNALQGWLFVTLEKPGAPTSQRIG